MTYILKTINLIWKKSRYIFYICCLLFFSNQIFAKVLSQKYTFDTTTAYKPKLALVFSGGGIRGISHIGALKALEENNIEFDYIAGTSIGAIIGGLYASGYSADEIDSIFTSIELQDFFNINLRNNRRGFYFNREVGNKSILSFYIKDLKLVIPDGLSEGIELNYLIYNTFLNSLYFPVKDYSDLKYKFIAIATDLVKGESVILKEGNIFKNIRASSTVPLAYTPVKKDSMILIDGGIMANLPVGLAKKEFKPDITVAFDITSPLYNSVELNNPIKVVDQTITLGMVYFRKKDAELADILIIPKPDTNESQDRLAIKTNIQNSYNATIENIENIKKIIDLKLDSFLLSSNFADMLSVKMEFTEFENQDIEKLNEISENLGKIKYLNQLICDRKYKSIDAYQIAPEIYSVKPTYFEKLEKIELSGTYSNFIADKINEFVEKNYKGHYLHDKLIAKLKEDILLEYKKKQMPNVYVNIKVKDDTVATIEIIESIVREIVVNGNQNISSETIRKHINIKLNQPLNVAKLIRNYEHLLSLNLFSEILFDVETIENGCKLLVEVRECEDQSLHFIGRVDNERNLQIGADLINENLFDGTLKNVLHFHLSSMSNSIYNHLANISLLNSNIAASITLYYDWKKNNIFQKNRVENKYITEVITQHVFQKYGLQIGLGMPIERRGYLGAFYKLEKQELVKEDKNRDLSTVSTLKFNFNYNNENDNFFATAGGKFDISLETGFLMPESTENFTKIEASIKYGWSYRDFYISPSFLFLVADKTMHNFDFFSLGGQDSFFGMRENEERGRQLFKTSLEFRQKMPKFISLFSFPTYLAMRYDLGSVWEVPEDIKFSGLKHGLGFSIMLDTPIGSANFSAGKMFNFAVSNDIYKVISGDILLYFSIGMKL